MEWNYYLQGSPALRDDRGPKHLSPLHLRAKVPQPPEGHHLAPPDHHPGWWAGPQTQPGRAPGGGHGEEAQHHHVPVSRHTASGCYRHTEAGRENEVWRIWKMRADERTPFPPIIKSDIKTMNLASIIPGQILNHFGGSIWKDSNEVFARIVNYSTMMVENDKYEFQFHNISNKIRKMK